MIYKILFFLVIIFLSLFYDFLNKKELKVSRFFCILIIIIISFFYSTREFLFANNDIGTDYFEYQKWFSDMNLSRALFTTNNIGFNFSIIIFKFFSNNFYLFLFLISMFVVSSFLYFGKINKINFKILLPFFIAFIFPSFCNIMRQWIAFSFFLFSYKYLITKKPYKYFLLIILGSTFHSSLITLLLVFPLINFKSNKTNHYKYKTVLTTILISFCYFFMRKIIPLLYQISDILKMNYNSKYSFSILPVSNYKTFLFSFTLLILLFFLKENIIKKNSEDEYYRNYLLLSLSTALMLLSTKYGEFLRISIYFNIYMLIAINYIIFSFEKEDLVIILPLYYLFLAYVYI